MGKRNFCAVGNFAVDVFGRVAVHVGSDGEGAKQSTLNRQLIFAWRERRGQVDTSAHVD